MVAATVPGANALASVDNNVSKVQPYPRPRDQLVRYGDGIYMLQKISRGRIRWLYVSPCIFFYFFFKFFYYYYFFFNSTPPWHTSPVQFQSKYVSHSAAIVTWSDQTAGLGWEVAILTPLWLGVQSHIIQYDGNYSKWVGDNCFSPQVGRVMKAAHNVMRKVMKSLVI